MASGPGGSPGGGFGLQTSEGAKAGQREGQKEAPWGQLPCPGQRRSPVPGSVQTLGLGRVCGWDTGFCPVCVTAVTVVPSARFSRRCRLCPLATPDSPTSRPLVRRSHHPRWPHLSPPATPGAGGGPGIRPWPGQKAQTPLSDSECWGAGRKGPPLPVLVAQQRGCWVSKALRPHSLPGAGVL